MMPFLFEKHLEIIEKALNFYNENYATQKMLNIIAAASRPIEKQKQMRNHLSLLGVIR